MTYAILILVILLIASTAIADPCDKGMLLFTNNNTCAKCPSGTVCPYQSGCSPSCLNCTTVGMIVDVNSNQSQCVSGVCNVCPVGGYCTSGTLFTNCSAGTFNNISGATAATACSPCIPGSYAAAGQSACLACTAGSKSLAGSSNCSVCPAGSMSLASSSACTACTPGYYTSAQGQSVCSPCTAGSISALASSSVCSPCPTGSMSLANSSACTPCTPGYFASIEGRSVCAPCPAGSVAPLGNASVCLDCQQGYYVVNEGSSVCTPCNAGYFSTATKATSNTTCVACPIGQYSTQITASITCSLCPLSTYQPNQGAQNISNCSACIPNSVTLAKGASAPTQCICDIGYYGQSGVSCTACAPGSYSENQNMGACTLCVANTVDAQAIVYPRSSFMGTCTDLSGILTKVTSPPGSTCQNASCAAGRYRSSNTCSSLTFGLTQIDAFCIPCTVNQYSLNGSTSCSNCINATTANALPGTSSASCSCLPGYYKSDVSSPSCTLCPANSYCPGAYVQNTTCPLNSFASGLGAISNTSCICNSGYFLGNTSASWCSPCTVLNWCPVGSTLPTPCPANTSSYVYSKTINDCYCLPGFMPLNKSGGLTGVPCTLCNSSQFCSGGAQSSCPQNSYVPAGTLGVTSSSCICILGYYPTSPGVCVQCPYGFYCPYNVSVAIPCANNSQSQAAQFSISSCSCNSGYYGFANMSSTTNISCIPCPNATYCSGGNTNGPSGFCQPNSTSYIASNSIWACTCNSGFYGSGGQCVVCQVGSYTLISTNASSCLACIPSKYSNSWPAIGMSNCLNCSAGSYSPLSNSSACIPCPQGSYSMSIGSSSQLLCSACPAGTFQPNIGVNSTTGCLACPPGTYTQLTGLITQTQCSNCTAGSYSVAYAQISNMTCQGCLQGTFSTGIGMPSNLTCSLCPSGFYQSSIGMSSNMSCQACSQGLYSSGLGQIWNSSCVACGSGSYSTGYAQTSNSSCSLCNQGSYSLSLGASSNQTCQLCPGGTYSSNYGAPSNATCTLCPMGQYSSGVGMTSPATCTNCSAGFFSMASGLAGNCTACAAGTYSSSIGASSMYTCIYCIAGTASVTVGANSSNTCSPCIPGSFSGMGWVNCAYCSIGQVLRGP